MTSTISLMNDFLTTTTSNLSSYSVTTPPSERKFVFLILLYQWISRLIFLFVFLLCPWVNYKLIEFFQTHSFHKDSSAKWYIVFKAIFDTLYLLISLPFIFFLTFNIDIIHKNLFTCKSITYIYYLSDDVITMMLVLLCIDRMIRITCNYRLRTNFSLIVCVIILNFFVILNIHHVMRLRHEDGVCRKVYVTVGDYDFDTYYSFIYTSITWAIIFLTSINLTISVYCDRTRRLKFKKLQQQQAQEQKISKIFLNDGEPLGGDSDRLELIHSTDDWDEPTAVTIEQTNPNRSWEYDQQDNIDLQITVCVLITSAIFLTCNLPNFIIFIVRAVYETRFSTTGYIFVYISLFPSLITHTISYFVFNHLSKRLFRNNSS